MAAVWYTGSSSKLTITVADWAKLGFSVAQDTVWEGANGFSLPSSMFTQAQLNVLINKGVFNINAPEGPRRPSFAAAAVTPKAPSVPLYVPRDSYTGPSTTDITSVTAGAAADASQNESYAIGANTLPAIWPVDKWGKLTISNNTQISLTSQSGIASVTTDRYMCDGANFTVFGYGAPFMADIFIDGKPYANNPVTLANTTGYGAYGFLKFVFPSAKPRLIEIRSLMGTVAVYTTKPYRVWKPAPDPNPKIAVVGDSFVAPTVMNDAASGQVASGAYLRGIYQRMPMWLGLTSLVTDGIGGTGYIAGGGSNKPYSEAGRIAWLQAINPDVIVVHGGGINDLYNGKTVSEIVAAVVSYFTTLRGNHPNAKLVFVEGFAPPAFVPQATYNSNYVLIRQQVQAQLNLKGVYYLDIATTRPPISGTGYVTATNASGNSDVYIGSDQAHPTIVGNQYIRHILAPKLRRVLQDDGRLDGALIL